ncbi:MAG: hypothetical protein CME06_13770 [Gemmatimonadetes bacterium]|nr:hypothetical protein [Gemmatimonadota bacterium]
MRTPTLLSVLTLTFANPYSHAQAAVCPPNLALDVALVEDLTISANVDEWQSLFLDAYVPNGTFMVYVQHRVLGGVTPASGTLL